MRAARMAESHTKGDSDLFLEYALRMTKGRVRVFSLLSAALLMLAVGTLYVLVVVTADHLSPDGLSAAVLVGSLVAVLAVEAVLAGVLIVGPLLQRLNDLWVARMIEKRHPEFRNDLTASLQLNEQVEVHSGVLAAIKRRTAREVASAGVEDAVDTRRVWPSVRRALGAVHVPAPRRTQIVDVQPERGRHVMTGRPVRFTARVRNGPGRHVVHISPDGGTTWLREHRLTMQPDPEEAQDAYTATWPAAFATDPPPPSNAST